MKAVGTVTWASGETQEAFEELTLLVHSMLEDREHDQLCGGQAECGTCRVRILAGAENLSAMTPDERELREEHPEFFAADERLACMTRPRGDVTCELPSEELPDLRDV